MKQWYEIPWQKKESVFLCIYWKKSVCSFLFKEPLSKVATLLEMLKDLVT